MDQFEAARTGNLEWFKGHKNYGTLPNLMDYVVYAGDLAQMYAAKAGHLEVLRWIVEESEQHIDLTASANRTLHEAILAGHVDVVKWLVKDYHEWLKAKKYTDPDFVGREVDINDNDSWAILHMPARGRREMFKWLVNESWKYGQELIPSTVITRVFRNFHESFVDDRKQPIPLEEFCSVYLEFRSLTEVGYTQVQALKIMISLQDSKPRLTKSLRI